MSPVLLAAALALAPQPPVPPETPVRLVYRRQGLVAAWAQEGDPDLDVEAVVARQLLQGALEDRFNGRSARARVRLMAARERARRSQHWGLRLLIADEMAESLRVQGDLGAAAAAYREALREAADEPQAAAPSASLQANLGAVLEQAGDAPGAARAYAASLRLLEASGRGAGPEAALLRARLGDGGALRAPPPPPPRSR